MGVRLELNLLILVELRLPQQQVLSRLGQLLAEEGPVVGAGRLLGQHDDPAVPGGPGTVSQGLGARLGSRAAPDDHHSLAAGVLGRAGTGLRTVAT